MNTDQIMDGVLIWKALIKVLIWNEYFIKYSFEMSTLVLEMSTLILKAHFRLYPPPGIHHQF